MPFGFTPRIDVTKIPTPLKYLPLHLPCVATFSAPAALAAEHLPRGVPPLVIHPVRPRTAVGPSRVFVSVLIDTVTVGPTARAEPAETSEPSALGETAPHDSARVLARTSPTFFMRATPFLEGCRLCGRGLVSWLAGLPTAPSRRDILASGIDAVGVPAHSRGSGAGVPRLSHP